MTSRASSALAARSRPRRTRSMPSSAGGASRGSSTVLTISLPMATPCSLTPCSAPHSQAGRDSSVAAAPRSGSSRYWVRSRPPAGPAGVGLDHLGLGDGAVRVLGEQRAVRAEDAQGVAHDGACRLGLPGPPTELGAQAAPLSGCQPARSARRGSLEKISTIGARRLEALLDALDVEDLVPQHQGGHHARARRRGPCGPSGAGRPCGPRAGRSARPRRRRRCRGPGRPRRWPPARAGARR